MRNEKFTFRPISFKFIVMSKILGSFVFTEKPVLHLNCLYDLPVEPRWIFSTLVYQTAFRDMQVEYFM
jgi:hypothetical protein